MEGSGSGIDDMAGIHHSYVAGRYRDGALSDTWTDVTRCADRTFVAYVARCGCGWRGNDHPANPDGYHTCQHELINNHVFRITGDTVSWPAPRAPRSPAQ